jgi:hypothetical protein
VARYYASHKNLQESLLMPKHIKYFEWTWLGSLALGIVLSVTKGPEIAAAGSGAQFFAFFGVGVSLLLVLLTSRRRSKIAKWVLVVFFAMGLVVYIQNVPAWLGMGFQGILSLIQVLAQCVGMYFLFTKESRDWYKKK